MARTKLLSLLLLCAAAVGAAAAFMWHPKPTMALQTGTLLAPSRALADFSLIDRPGRSFGTGRA